MIPYDKGRIVEREVVAGVQRFMSEEDKHLNEPLSASETTTQIRLILRTGLVRFSSHALAEMENEDLCETDVLNCLRCGVMFEPAEYERGHQEGIWSWRYRIHTERQCVVIAFRDQLTLVIVTTWRKARRGR